MPAESVDGRKRQEQYEKFLDMIGTLDGTLPPYDLDHIVARHQFRQEQVKLIPASSAVHMLIEADRHLDIVLDHLLALMAATSTGTDDGRRNGAAEGTADSPDLGAPSSPLYPTDVLERAAEAVYRATFEREHPVMGYEAKRVVQAVIAALSASDGDES